MSGLTTELLLFSVWQGLGTQGPEKQKEIPRLLEAGIHSPFSRPLSKLLKISYMSSLSKP